MKLDCKYIFVSGLPGTGKSMLAEILAKEWNCDLFDVTQFVRDYFNTQDRLGLKDKPYIGDILLQHILTFTEPTVIVGQRNKDLYNYMQEHDVPCQLILLEAPKQFRFNRITQRGNSKDAGIDLNTMDEIDYSFGFESFYSSK